MSVDGGGCTSFGSISLESVSAVLNVVFNKSEDAAVRWVVDFAQSNNSQIHTMLGFAIRYSTTHVENCDAVT